MFALRALRSRGARSARRPENRSAPHARSQRAKIPGWKASSPLDQNPQHDKQRREDEIHEQGDERKREQQPNRVQESEAAGHRSG